MKKTNSSKILVIVVGVIAAVFLVLKLLGSSSAWIFLIAALLVLAAIAAAVILLTVFAIGMGKKDFEKRKTAFSETGERPEEIKQAKSRMLSIHRQLREVSSAAVSRKAQETCGLCEKIIDTVSGQPGEIGRCGQFFNYYLPTFETVLQKYRTLEKAEVNASPAEEKILSILEKMNTALDEQYKNLFSNELLDLTVEMKALETIIKKDGLG